MSKIWNRATSPLDCSPISPCPSLRNATLAGFPFVLPAFMLCSSVQSSLVYAWQQFGFQLLRRPSGFGIGRYTWLPKYLWYFVYETQSIRCSIIPEKCVVFSLESYCFTSWSAAARQASWFAVNVSKWLILTICSEIRFHNAISLWVKSIALAWNALLLHCGFNFAILCRHLI